MVACGDSGAVSESKEELGQIPVGRGKELYENNCMACHGIDGALGAGGAFDLKESVLSDQEVAEIIENGRKGMPPHSHVYKNEQELDSLVEYVRILREE